MVLRGSALVIAITSVFYMHAESHLTLMSDAGFLIATRDKAKQKKVIKQSVDVALINGDLHIDNYPVHDDMIVVSPVEGAIYHNNTRYTNTVAISALEKKLSVVPIAKSKQYKRPAKTLKQLAQLQKQTSVGYVKKNQPITIRVLLDQLDRSGMWKLESPDGFVVWDPKSAKRKWRIKRETVFFVRKGNAFYLNGKRFNHDKLYIRPYIGYVHFNGNSYDGGFLVHHSKKQSMLINCLDLEQYIFSVLRSESWPGWPLEVNKVFAIASRSYVIAMALRAKKTQKPYHVRNTNIHQTYTGVHKCKIIKRAVDQTRGMFLSYENSPIIAMFDCCCGGVIPAHIADFNFADAPYLAREYACMFCKKCRIYSWQAECDLKHFEKQLTARVTPIARVKDVRITHKDKAGLVKKVAIKSAVRPLTISGQRLYSLIDDVKSYHFNVRKKGTKLVFSGRGYGHHLGLCQWGARQMVRDGYDYQQILQFYYPGTNFKKLS